MITSRSLVALALAAAAGLVAACGGTRRGYVQGRSADFSALDTAAADPSWLGAARFVYDDFGGLNSDALRTSGLPWKVVAAALALGRQDLTGEAPSRSGLYRSMSEFGLVIPTAIANWPAGPPPRPLDRPLGLITGYGQRSFPVRLKIEIGNLGCAACHAGVLYDRRGEPLRDVWLGLPNTSLDLEAFSQAVYRAVGRTVGDRRRVLATVRALFPETDALELRTIERQLLPRIERALADLRAAGDSPSPYPNGAPGLTNGAGALKRQFGLLPPDAMRSEVGFTSIPELGDVLLRSSLLADGGFAAPGATRFGARSTGQITERHAAELAAMVAFFTVPTMGNHPSRIERVIPRVIEVMRFLRGYTPPRFPGPVDSRLTREGRGTYAARCADCHGSYDTSLASPRLVSFPNRLVPLAEIGTDAARLTVSDAAMLRALLETAYRRHIVPTPTGGYVAPRLSALWATAPYLHNGSVPTLWHLMNPVARPVRFYSGGHRLDFDLVGIAGSPDSGGTWRDSSGYVPWSRPALYDTSRPGLGNGGHEREFESLTVAQKRALLEYLKLL